MMKFDATEKVIKMLLEDDILAKGVNGEIRPVVARYGTGLPYIVASCENADVRYAKIGEVVGISADVMLTIVAESYESLRRIVDRITMAKHPFRIDSYKEDYAEDKYVAMMSVNIDY